MIKREKILITVKTYPSLSVTKGNEFVCTAGLNEKGNWIRIYPVPFRQLKIQKRYKKYQWVSLDLKKDKSDPRLESYSPVNIDNLEIGELIDTENGTWRTRKKLVLKNVYYDMDKLISEAKDRDLCRSLATFKPAKIENFKIDKKDIKKEMKNIESIKEKLRQLDLFNEAIEKIDLVNRVPYKFSFVFRDKNNKSFTLKIEDWEIYQLYWNCFKKHNNAEQALKEVKKKYWDEFVLKKDLYFFLGTTSMFHFMAPNPFFIIGVFYPPIIEQYDLF